MYEPEGMDDSKETVSSRCCRTGAHVSSQRPWEYAQGLQMLEPDKIPALPSRSGGKDPVLTKNLPAIYTCWGGKISFLQQSVTRYVSTSQRKLHAQEQMGNTNTRHSIFVDFFYICFVLLFFVCLFPFCLVILIFSFVLILRNFGHEFG